MGDAEHALAIHDLVAETLPLTFGDDQEEERGMRVAAQLNRSELEARVSLKRAFRSKNGQRTSLTLVSLEPRPGLAAGLRHRADQMALDLGTGAGSILHGN